MNSIDLGVLAAVAVAWILLGAIATRIKIRFEIWGDLRSENSPASLDDMFFVFTGPVFLLGYWPLKALCFCLYHAFRWALGPIVNFQSVSFREWFAVRPTAG